MFIAVRGRARYIEQVKAYLYDGQNVVTEPVQGTYGTFVVVDTGTADTYRSEYIRDRLQSGMFGATLFDTLEEATAYIEAEKD